FYLNCPGLAASTVIQKDIGLYIENFSGPPYSVDENDILMRFGNVFQQTYTRFLDLQKAEAQAREARIETALEKVRTHTMGMRSSKDLSHVTSILFEEMKNLGGDLFAFGIVLCDNYENVVEQWHSLADKGMISPFQVPVDLDYIHQYRYDQWKSGKDLFSIEIPEDYIQEHFDKMYTLPSFKKAMEEVAAKGYDITTPTWELDYGASFSHGYLLVSSVAPFEESHIFPRFAKVFEQAYTRFLDLQTAEAQAREAQIETALERVRSRTRAMQHSDELAEASYMLDKEVRGLGIKTWGCAFNIYREKDSIEWFGNEAGLLPTYTVPREGIFKEYFDAGQKGESLLVKEIAGEQCTAHYEFMSTLPVVGDVLRQLKKTNGSFPSYQIDHVAYFKYGYLLFITREAVPEAHDIFKRFAKVFEQTYTRFLDLKKAEAQTREAQIELSLERIRAQVTAMQESADLLDIVVTMRCEFTKLGHDAYYFWHMRWLPDIYKKAMTSGDGTRIGMVMTLPRHIHGDIPLLAEWEKSVVPTVVYAMDAEAAIDYVDKMVSLGDFQQVDPQAPSADDIRHIGGLTFVMARTTHGEIGYSLPGVVLEPPAEALETLVRFAGVFDLAYRRFEDLIEAEKQKREAEIELALERVRARTMAMQNSDELREVVLVMNEQLQQLEFESYACNIIILNKDTGDANYWVSGFTQDIYPVSYRVPYLDHPYYKALLKPWKRGAQYVVYKYTENEKKSFDKIFFSRTDFKNAPAEAKKTMKRLPEITLSTAYFIHGAVQAIGTEALPEEKAIILQRFAKVFEQTYTRFLDLKKAEEQAREAKIETALEKVRSRSMAMHHSSELNSVLAKVFQELTSLGFEMERAVIWTYYPENRSVRWWAANPEAESGSESFYIANQDDPVYDEYWKAWEDRRSKYLYILEGVYKENWTEILFNRTELGRLPDVVKAGMVRPEKVYLYNTFNDFGVLFISCLEPLPEEKFSILERFGRVFDQSYTRFQDIQKAEAQTRESKIETAMERVRARALAMQEPEELKEVAEVLRHEMGLLGVEELETSSIYINDEKVQIAECWFAIKDLREEKKVILTDHCSLDLNDTWVGREMLNFFKTEKDRVSIEMKGKVRKEWIDYCEKHSKVFQGYYGEVIPERTYHLYKFSHGAIGAATPGNLSDESWKLLQRAASVFSLAYSRFKDLTQARLDLKKLKEEKKRAEDALKELQLTQQQLVHAEKMASLGELTAGIAHEIQNPLNFVNNFSEVSRELIEELLEEMKRGEVEEVDAIAKDIMQNLEKILHHGQRADSIVKGMLQHSRSSDGKKEKTNLNALADEYLRLAYHGMRAKNKTFNATIETEFDSNLPKIAIVPQDIGRVLLNLITNAFHAV
ncbi:sensor histidine kinase, partial [Robiginitalea sp.]|uniref:sensor histidine kinase n=1 Tax=Robiginitalea sp. TaxID=1902411 RepID=UPI003C74B41C